MHELFSFVLLTSARLLHHASVINPFSSPLSSTFRQRIIIEKKESIFKAEGRFTFFIPVDEGFKVSRFSELTIRRDDCLKKSINFPKFNYGFG